jgi:hypothetical protein
MMAIRPRTIMNQELKLWNADRINNPPTMSGRIDSSLGLKFLKTGENVFLTFSV